MVQINEINENNIEDVLRQVGVEFDDFEILPTSLTKHKDFPEANFVVKLDDKIQAVDLLDGPVTDRFAVNAAVKIFTLDENIPGDVNHPIYFVLSSFEDSRYVKVTVGDLTVCFQLYSLENVSL